MEFKHEKRTNTAYIKTVDLQLNGNQISLAERPKSKEQLIIRKKIARSLRPCNLRRPWSATPSLGYRPPSPPATSPTVDQLCAERKFHPLPSPYYLDAFLLDPWLELDLQFVCSGGHEWFSGPCSPCESTLDMNRGKRIPPWSRPQSAGGSSSMRRNKLAAKFSDSSLNDPDYMPEFGATYALSSSQLLQSLMGSCSLNEGLDSDTTPTPSPQPSLGDTIRAAAQLEPGLTAKPPLPPSTTPQPRPESTSTDEIIALKFQRWFPESVLESEVVKRTSLTVSPFETHKDEGDNSDAGISVVDGAELSDRENDRPSSNNVSTFVKKRRTPKSSNEEREKSILKVNKKHLDNNDKVSEGKKSPKIVILEPDPYGFDVVTEEFSSEHNIRSLTPDYLKSSKQSSNFSKGKSFKRLSLSDLNFKSSTHSVARSHSVQLNSDSDFFKDDDINVRAENAQGYYEGLSETELYKNNEGRKVNISKQNESRNEIASPANFETSASKFRFTSTPINVENNPNISGNNTKDQNTEQIKNDTDFHDPTCKESSYINHNIEGSSEAQQCEFYNSLSPPIRLGSEKEASYQDYLPNKRLSTEIPIKTTKKEMDVLKNDAIYIDQRKCELDKQEKHAHFIDDPIRNPQSELQVKIEESQINAENYDYWPEPCRPIERRLSYPVKEKRTTHSLLKNSTKHGSLENMNKDVGRKTNKPNKEMCRAASVPPFQNSKLPIHPKRNQPVKETPTNSENHKRKNKRSMSYDSASNHDISEKDSGVSSYEDIVTMIRVLEKEDLDSPVIKYKTSAPLDGLVPDQSSSANAILNFLDEVERGSMVLVDTDRNFSTISEEIVPSSREPPVSSRLGSLLNTDTAELAQHVMTVTLQLEEKSAVCKAVEDRYRQSVELLKQQKVESDETDRRHQKFIDQLLKEKRLLAVQYETALREMEVKQENAIKVIEERHKVEMKKAQEKFNAAEKIRRDKWIDTKTKKIKELTVKGLEPELERMAATHQEELAELRRAHQRQLTEAESGFARRAAALREQEANERQAAVLHEREAARHRLEQEMCQVEKSYQEQRRRLLEEVRQEKELLQRQSERIIAEKQTEMAKQMDEVKQKLQAKLAEYDKQHQEEIAKIKESLEVDKQTWLSRQKGTLEEKEAALREELKRERDRHIELVIRRLESEAATKERAIENKIKRLKESYDSEVNDLDANLKELRSRLKEARADLQKSEDNNAALKAQLSQAQNEVLPLRQVYEKLHKEHQDSIRQSESKIAEMQKELSETKQSFQEQVNKIHNDKEKQLQQVYTRVKEAISKKEEALLLVTKQRDAALEQCNQLEKLLENQRNHSLKL